MFEITEKIKMPKMKTNRAAAKRFKKTGSGKFVFAKSHANHILTKKTTKRKRALRQSQIISKSNKKVLKQLLPNG
jgi:large subunit ribosomal protein L35